MCIGVHVPKVTQLLAPEKGPGYHLVHLLQKNGGIIVILGYLLIFGWEMLHWILPRDLQSKIINAFYRSLGA